MPRSRCTFVADSGRPSMRAALAGAVALVVSLVACVDVDGGAVEASWVVRTEDGRAIGGCGCADPSIDRVRFRVLRVGTGGDGATGEDACAVLGAKCEFSCDRNTGATPFRVAPGRYLVSLVPIDAQGQDLTLPSAERTRTVGVPAPVLRDVRTGQASQLETFLIVAGCAPACSAANNNRVCERP